jgi:acyl-coenzyme A thioesterase PaaI-like protein
MSQLLAMYNSVGNTAFSGMIGQIAPFFSTIDARFTELRPNFAEITMPFRREVTNHLGTVHAIAMCNMAELVAGTMTDASIPAGCRWIPKAMSVQYLAKAKTDLRAVSSGEGLDWTAGGDIDVPVDVFDTNGTQVFSAKITMNVRPGDLVLSADAQKMA